jgi:hypothetical protein
MIRLSTLCLGLILSAHMLQAQTADDHRIPHQILGGTVVGAFGGLVGGGVGSLMTITDQTGWSRLGAVLAGSTIGFTLGNGAGVYHFGNTERAKGNLAWTWAGSATGLVMGVGLGSTAPDLLLPVLASSVTLGSMLGYNLTRKSTFTVLRPSATGMTFIRIDFH